MFMVSFQVLCHNCFEKTTMAREQAPLFCPGCGDVLRNGVTVITRFTDLNQYK